MTRGQWDDNRKNTHQQPLVILNDSNSWQKRKATTHGKRRSTLRLLVAVHGVLWKKDSPRQADSRFGLEGRSAAELLPTLAVRHHRVCQWIQLEAP